MRRGCFGKQRALTWEILLGIPGRSQHALKCMPTGAEAREGPPRWEGLGAWRRELLGDGNLYTPTTKRMDVRDRAGHRNLHRLAGSFPHRYRPTPGPRSPSPTQPTPRTGTNVAVPRRAGLRRALPVLIGVTATSSR